MAALSVLHLVGSAEDDFHAELSALYAREVLSPEGTRARFARVEPGGRWRFGDHLDALGEAVDAPAALARIAGDRPDLVVPHMFCASGMTTYRALMEDVLGLPVVGSRAATCAVAADKPWTRGVLAAAGVEVARGAVLAPGDAAPDLGFPVVVKPASVDNSMGLSFVASAAGMEAALDAAFAQDGRILVETYIPGREIRLCVVETEDGPVVPATMEYPVSAERPVREVADKLDIAEDGTPRAQTVRATAKPTVPAELAPELRARLEATALAAHRALDCRDYSLWDVRVRDGDEAVVVLEAGLFWAFSEISMISAMLAADGHLVEDVVGAMWRRAAARGASPG